MNDKIAAERQKRQRALLYFIEAHAYWIGRGLAHVHSHDLAEQFSGLEFRQRTAITNDDIQE